LYIFFTIFDQAFHYFTAVSNNENNAIKADFRKMIEYMKDHRAAQNGKSDFGELGFHPRSFSCSKYYGGPLIHDLP
jgi:hypothetical protein